MSKKLFVFVLVVVLSFSVVGLAMAKTNDAQVSHIDCTEMLVVFDSAPEGLLGTTATAQIKRPDGSTVTVTSNGGYYNGHTAKWSFPSAGWFNGDGTYTVTSVTLPSGSVHNLPFSGNVSGCVETPVPTATENPTATPTQEATPDPTDDPEETPDPTQNPTGTPDPTQDPTQQATPDPTQDPSQTPEDPDDPNTPVKTPTQPPAKWPTHVTCEQLGEGWTGLAFEVGPYNGVATAQGKFGKVSVQFDPSYAGQKLDLYVGGTKVNTWLIPGSDRAGTNNWCVVETESPRDPGNPVPATGGSEFPPENSGSISLLAMAALVAILGGAYLVLRPRSR